MHVSHYEADAFARWAGARLPTEFEWEHAISAPAIGPIPDLVASLTTRRTGPGCTRPPRRPVRGCARRSATCGSGPPSAYLPYPRFAPAAGAVGEYNGKFMSGQMVLRGGACITPAGHVRTTYRNFFPPSSRWMFAGVRLAADT